MMEYPTNGNKRGNAKDGGFKPVPKPPVNKTDVGPTGYVTETVDGTFVDMNRDPRYDVKGAIAFLEECKRKAVQS